jgi:serine phosphatase RsbU (regulator of sigma subunit)
VNPLDPMDSDNIVPATDLPEPLEQAEILPSTNATEPEAKAPASPSWKRPGFHSIRWEIGLAFSLLILAIGLLLGITSIENSRSLLRKQTLYMIASLGRGIASASAGNAVLPPGEREPLLSRTCYDVKKDNKDVAMILILDRDDRIIGDEEVAYALANNKYTAPTNLAKAHDSPELRQHESFEENRDYFFLRTPLLLGKDRIFTGSVYLVYSKKSIEESVENSRNQLITFVIIFLAVGVFASFLIAGMVIGPARRLAEAANAIGEGNLDARVRVLGRHELGLLAHSFNDMALSLEVAQRELLAKQRMEFELNIASQIQRSLLPLDFPTPQGYDISAVCASAYEVGGDYYDLIQVDAEHMGFCVGDVSGKGVPGLLVMAMVRHIVRTMAHQYFSPRQVLVQSNQLITEDIKKGMFVTLFYGLIDLRNHRLTFANAGHPPLIIRHQGGKVEKVESQGRPMGLGVGPFFDARIAESTLDISPGTLLFEYTDGIYDTQSPEGEAFGEERFLDTIKHLRVESARDAIEEIYNSVKHFAGTRREAVDDITILAIERIKP